MDILAERERFLSVHLALVDEGLLEPLSKDPDDTRLWMNCDLASMVENRFFQAIDPHTLSESERARWKAKAVASDEFLANPHREESYSRAYWILHEGERVGTVGLATMAYGPNLLGVSSFYLLPPYRGKGIGSAFMRRAKDIACKEGLYGLRVATHWTWQPAVRLYLHLGMWVYMWKHALVFFWGNKLPKHRICIEGDKASFAIEKDGKVMLLIYAARRGDTLRWRETPAMKALVKDDFTVYAHAPGTFALALATHGFPLIRSKERWKRRYEQSDMGGPEGLAYKIEIFEAWDRKQGFEIRTPRIPGIAYRDYDQFR